MNIRCRLMQHRDIPGCLAMIASHTTLADRYGETLPRLGESWRRLIGQLAFVGVVLEEVDADGFRMLALGTRFFISDAFATEIKTPPLRWAGPEIMHRVLVGRSPLLTDKQVREANRSGGLNLFAGETPLNVHDMSRHEIISALYTEFSQQHRGFLLKELMTQSLSFETLDGQLRSGGLLLNQQGQYTVPVDPLEKIIRKPHLVGITRAQAMQQYGTYVSLLFLYSPPRFDLHLGEQRFLMFALDGLTDADLADRLCVSLSAVKKTWRRIYDRVGTIDPELIPDNLPEDGSHERGAMKKQRLLAYLREHIEELRPVQSHP